MTRLPARLLSLISTASLVSAAGCAHAAHAPAAATRAGAGPAPPAHASSPATAVVADRPVEDPRELAMARLREAGLSRKFRGIVGSVFDERPRDQVVAMNILGFLYTGDYSAHFGGRALRECRDLLKRHRKAFALARARYGVEPEAIASLLWVETKHGRILGAYPVAGVYFSLLQADHPAVVASTLKALALKVPEVTPELRAKVEERSRTKAQWALQELKSLATMQHQGRVDARTLKGSFAGAFGVPQFIPSSYSQWAQASKGPGPADLFRMDDAIQSVARYLSEHGWKSGDRQAQVDALFGYNRSKDYGAVILRIAACLKPNGAQGVAMSGRLPAEELACEVR